MKNTCESPPITFLSSYHPLAYYSNDNIKQLKDQGLNSSVGENTDITVNILTFCILKKRCDCNALIQNKICLDDKHVIAILNIIDMF